MVSGALRTSSLTAILAALPGIHEVSNPQRSATATKMAIQASENSVILGSDNLLLGSFITPSMKD